MSYSVNQQGQGTVISDNTSLEGCAYSWLHLDANDPSAIEMLSREDMALSPLVIDALLADETRPRMYAVDKGALLILRGVNLNEHSAPEDMVSIRMWVEKDRIISVRRRKLKAVADIQQQLDQGCGPTNTGDFVCTLVSHLFDRMEPVLAELDDATDDIEENLLVSANTNLRESIVDVRKKAIMFRRYMAPQREAINQLRMCSLEWLTAEHKHQLVESYNHVTRYVEDLDAIRERSQIVKDELANILSDRLNKNMYILSVIAAIFLPLGFLTGLLGLNVGGIPGAENSEAFYMVCGILTAIVIIQIAIFKKLKWF